MIESPRVAREICEPSLPSSFFFFFGFGGFFFSLSFIFLLGLTVKRRRRYALRNFLIFIFILF